MEVKQNEGRDEFEKHAASLIFPISRSNDGFARYFSGRSFLAPVSWEQAGIFHVSFEPGGRSHWHIHHGEDRRWSEPTLRGRTGLLSGWGKKAVELFPGDVGNLLVGVKHRHGTAPLVRQYESL